LFDRPADLSAPGMVKVLDADGVEQLVPAVDYSGRGMDAGTRERLKAEILQRAIDNGEVQAPISPLPNRPVTTFEQGSLVDDLLADPDGQLPLLFASDAMPTYKAGGKGGDALIEEMRLRFEYNLLDEQAQQAQRQAMMAAHGWDTLTWQEKKKLGILDDGFYSLKPFSERFQDPTPQFNPELDAGAPRQPRVYEWKPEELEGQLTDALDMGPAAAKAADAPAKPGRIVKERQAEEARQAKVEKRQAMAGIAKVDAARAAILKEMDDLTRKSQGAKC
jgi:hypothetical protein